MKITVDAFWDDEARVWVATAQGDIGLITEAATIEELQRRLADIAPDLLGENCDGPIEVDLIARSHLTIAA